jgi:hypothetical protein
VERVVGLCMLVVAGILSLPIAAAALDGEGSENWIIPAQLGGMAVVGALVGLTIPALTGSGSPARRALLGALMGFGVALVGVIIFFLLLNGFDGA